MLHSYDACVIRSVLSGLVVGIAVVVLLLFTTGCASAQLKVKDSLNADRRHYGRHSLPTHSAPNRKAQRWAEQLAHENRLRHSSITSGVPSCWRSLGENVGYGSSIGAVQTPLHELREPPGERPGDEVEVRRRRRARRGTRWFTVQVFMQGC